MVKLYEEVGFDTNMIEPPKEVALDINMVKQLKVVTLETNIADSPDTNTYNLHEAANSDNDNQT